MPEMKSTLNIGNSMSRRKEQGTWKYSSKTIWNNVEKESEQQQQNCLNDLWENCEYICNCRKEEEEGIIYE